MATCSTCGGGKKCKACNGKGKIYINDPVANASGQKGTTCKHCRGGGSCPDYEYKPLI